MPVATASARSGSVTRVGVVRSGRHVSTTRAKSRPVPSAVPSPSEKVSLMPQTKAGWPQFSRIRGLPGTPYELDKQELEGRTVIVEENSDFLGQFLDQAIRTATEQYDNCQRKIYSLEKNREQISAALMKIRKGRW